jgi:hypothetical protein
MARPRVDRPERSASDAFDDDDSLVAPRRPGAVIGADESESEAPAKIKRTSPSIKPIIDVRRGVFPGRNSDDFDDDELGDAIARPPVTPPTKPKRQDRGGPARFKKSTAGRSKHPRDSHGSKRHTGRKGRRR